MGAGTAGAGTLAAVATIAARDLRQRLRDRSAIVIGFVAPVLIAGLMSQAFRGLGEFDITLALVDADGGAMPAAFRDALEEPELAEIVTVEAMEEAQARQEVLAGRIDAVVIFPPGFSDAALGGRPASISVTTSAGAEVAGSVAGAIVESFVARLNATRLAAATAILAGMPPERAGAAAQAAAARPPPADIVEEALAGRELRVISYMAPAMGIFFVLFAVGFAARSFAAERSQGTLARMAAAPLRPAAILAGKALAVAVYCATSLAVMAVVTTVAFGADWGPAPGAAALVLAMVLAVVALAALAMVVARSERQAEQFSGVMVLALALLGGNFFFAPLAPELMRRLALLTPNGWALRGFTDLATGAGAGAAVRPVLAIVVFSALTGAVAALLARRAVLR